MRWQDRQALRRALRKEKYRNRLIVPSDMVKVAVDMFVQTNKFLQSLPYA